MQRSAEDIRSDIQDITKFLNEQASKPAVASYLSKKATLKDLINRALQINSPFDPILNNEIATLTNALNEIENDPNNIEIANYIINTNLKNQFVEELNLVRGEKYLTTVKNCRHVFYTGPTKGHTVTTCLKCNISSNMIGCSNFDLKRIAENLFCNGEMHNSKYVKISAIMISSFEKARKIWRAITAADKKIEDLPPEEVTLRLSRAMKYDI